MLHFLWKKFNIKFSKGPFKTMFLIFCVCDNLNWLLLFFYCRRSSYGPLVESSDYGTLGNFSNPMYDPWFFNLRSQENWKCFKLWLECVDSMWLRGSVWADLTSRLHLPSVKLHTLLFVGTAATRGTSDVK